MRIERRPRREVRVQVLVAALDDPPRARGQRAQRARPLLAPQRRRRARSRAQASGWRRTSQSRSRDPACATSRARTWTSRSSGASGLGCARRRRGLHARVVTEAAQRLQLVDDERLRQHRPLVKDEQQPHDRPTVERRGALASPSAPATLQTAAGGEFHGLRHRPLALACTYVSGQQSHPPVCAGRSRRARRALAAAGRRCSPIRRQVAGDAEAGVAAAEAFARFRVAVVAAGSEAR